MDAAKFQIGPMRHRVAIYALAETAANEYHEVPRVPGDQPIAWRWADVQELAGKEYWWAQQAQAMTTHVVRLYFFAGLSPLTHRLKLEDRWLNIERVTNPDGVNVWHVLHCVAAADPAKAKAQ